MFGPPNMDYCLNEAVLHMKYLQVHPGTQLYSFQNIIAWAFLCWFWGKIVYLEVWGDDNFPC